MSRQLGNLAFAKDGATTFSIMTLSIMTLSIMTLSITTFSLKPLSVVAVRIAINKT
jgi:hypothetical protein